VELKISNQQEEAKFQKHPAPKIGLWPIFIPLIHCPPQLTSLLCSVNTGCLQTSV